MKQVQKLAIIAACVGVNIGDFIPAEPIRIGNKSLPDDDQRDLINKAAEKRLRKMQNRAAISKNKGE